MDSATRVVLLTDLTTDKSGSAYITGYLGIGEEIHFGTVTLSSGAFIAKYNSQGIAEWAKVFDPSPTSFAHIAVDEEREAIYTLTNSNSGILLSRYDPDGMKIWDRQVAGVMNFVPLGYDLAVDAQGSIYVTGRVERETYIGKFDDAGNEIWSRRFTSTGGDFIPVWLPVALAIDNEGKIYLAIDVNDLAAGDMRIIKLDESGEVIWERREIGCVPTAIAYDGRDGIVVSMRFRGLGTIPDSLSTAAGTGHCPAALIRYNRNGERTDLTPFFVSPFYAGIQELAFNSRGDLFVRGSFGSAKDTLSVQTRTSISDSPGQTFLAKFDNELNLINIDTLDRRLGQLITAGREEIYLSGFIGSEINQLGGINLEPHELAIFVGKLDASLSVDGKQSTTNPVVYLRPNPANTTTHLTTDYNHVDRVAIYTVDGRLLRQIEKPEVKSEIEIDFENLPAGAYHVIVDGDKGQSVLNVVKM